MFLTSNIRKEIEGGRGNKPLDFGFPLMTQVDRADDQLRKIGDVAVRVAELSICYNECEMNLTMTSELTEVTGELAFRIVHPSIVREAAYCAKDLHSFAKSDAVHQQDRFTFKCSFEHAVDPD